MLTSPTQIGVRWLSAEELLLLVVVVDMLDVCINSRVRQQNKFECSWLVCRASVYLQMISCYSSLSWFEHCFSGCLAAMFRTR